MIVMFQCGPLIALFSDIRVLDIQPSDVLDEKTGAIEVFLSLEQDLSDKC